MELIINNKYKVLYNFQFTNKRYQISWCQIKHEPTEQTSVTKYKLHTTIECLCRNQRSKFLVRFLFVLLRLTYDDALLWQDYPLCPVATLDLNVLTTTEGL